MGPSGSDFGCLPSPDFPYLACGGRKVQAAWIASDSFLISTSDVSLTSHLSITKKGLVQVLLAQRA